MEKLSLKDAFKEARTIAQNTSPKATFILDRIVPKYIRNYLNLCYSYLRWVDDFIDDPIISLFEKKKFINRQKLLVKSFNNNFSEEPLLTEEYFLFYFLEFAFQNDLEMIINSVYQMVDTISWDVARFEKDGVFTKKQLNDYISIQSESIQKYIVFFHNWIRPPRL